MAAAYDLGCAIYFAVPTAPPWWAAEHGYMAEELGGAERRVDRAEQPRVRRVMVEVGEEDLGARLAEALSSRSAATRGRRCRRSTSPPRCSRRSCSPRPAPLAGRASAGPTPGRSGFALVYLGEHYAIDLLAGAALVRAGPAGRAAGRAARAADQRRFSAWSAREL